MQKTLFPVELHKKSSVVFGYVYVEDREIHILDQNKEKIDIWDEYSCHIFKKGDKIIFQGTTQEDFHIESKHAQKLTQVLNEKLDLKLGRGKVSNSIWIESKRYVLYFFILTGISLGTSMYIRWNPEKFMTFYSPQDEIKIGDEYFDQVMKDRVYAKDSNVSIEFHKIIDPFLAKLDTKPYDIRVNVLKEKKANAFALPGGNIVFTEGFLAEAESHEEILGVLGHEVGHVMKRHSMKRIVGERFSSWVRLLLLDTSFMENIANTLDSLRYSRENEAEADEYAIDLMKKFELSPQGMIDFFNRPRKETKVSKSYKAAEWLSTHPLGNDRIQNLEDALKSIGIKDKNTNLEALKNELKDTPELEEAS